MELSKLPQSVSYKPHLDGLRGLAALAVLFYHLQTPYSRLGFLGVDVFFVLSGYLISSIVACEYQKGTFSFLRFMKNRFVRLYPALVVFLGVGLFSFPLMFPTLSLWEHLKYIVFAGVYATNFLYLADYVSPVIHTWTLAIEFHFYLLWPFVLVGLLKYQKGKIVPILFLLWVLVGLWRVYSYSQLYLGWDVYFRTDTHCSGLILGSLIAFCNFDGLTGLARKLLKLLLGLVVVFCLWWLAKLHYAQEEIVRWGFTMAEIFTALLIVYEPSWEKFKPLSFAPLVWLGKISYGFYLWHYPIVKYLRLYDFSWQTDFIITVVATLVLASLSYYLLEQPIRRWYYRNGHSLVKKKAT